MKQVQIEILEQTQSARMTAEAHGFDATADALKDIFGELAQEFGCERQVPNAADLCHDVLG